MLRENVAQSLGAGLLVVQLLRHDKFHHIRVSADSAHHGAAVDNEIAQVVQQLNESDTGTSNRGIRKENTKLNE